MRERRLLILFSFGGNRDVAFSIRVFVSNVFMVIVYSKKMVKLTLIEEDLEEKKEML